MVAYRGISHLCVACSIGWLLKPISFFQKSRQVPWIHSRVGNLPSAVYLPASDAKCPLHSVLCVGNSHTIMTIVLNKICMHKYMDSPKQASSYISFRWCKWSNVGLRGIWRAQNHSELTHNTNDITLQHYNGFGYGAQHHDVTAWRAIQTATVAMHADGNGTGSSLRSWVLNYITTSVKILWGFQYSVMYV